MIFFIITAVIIGFYVMYSYNRLIQLRNRVRESFRTIDIFLQQRFDALSQIAETVASYTKHEKETLQRITELRAGYHPDLPEEKKIELYNQMEKTAAFINLENYPELKANENYNQLQRTINDLEEKLSASRRTYNANATLFNTMIQSIPTNLYASMLGFQSKELLQIDEAKKGDVDLKSILRG